MPYSQCVPGSNISGTFSKSCRPVRDARQPRRLDIPPKIGVEDVVAVAGGVGQQVAHRHRAVRRPQARFAGIVEAFQHLHVAG